MTTDLYTIPAATLPDLANWTTSQLGLNAPQLMHLSEHQQNAQIKIALSGGGDYHTVLQQGCDSLGIIPRFDEYGQLQLIGMDYARAADYAITYDDIREISVASELPELTELLLRYGYDHENSEYTGRILFQNSAHHYPENWPESMEVDTVIVNRVDAVNDGNRRALRRFVRRRLYFITCFIRGVIFRTGDRLHVFHPLWGLDATGTIWDVERLPGSNEAMLEVEI